MIGIANAIIGVNFQTDTTPECVGFIGFSNPSFKPMPFKYHLELKLKYASEYII